MKQMKARAQGQGQGQGSKSMQAGAFSGVSPHLWAKKELHF
jgi:hypothetical protein